MYYCTLFDKHYLTRGLALYESLKKVTKKFHLYIFAFDDLSLKTLNSLKLTHATVISLSEFENQALLNIKPSRSRGEYCWTCTPSVIKYSIERYKLPQCTYLDADLYFFSDPATLIKEMKDKSILITEHRYPPNNDQSRISGIYCVQFITFKNTPDGITTLNWWANACLDWCYSWIEDGKFGDQKYLDDWTTRFKGVHVSQHLGSVAPWNVSEYNSDTTSLIFYHFHELTFLNEYRVNLSSYHLCETDIINIYKPYLKHLTKINKKLIATKLNNIETYHYVTQQPLSKKLINIIRKIYLCRPFRYRMIYLLHLIKVIFKSTSNIYSLKKFD